uniref:Uncharacterized protein n=1 Tax=Nelumbo nucifera TaxID=4432 RepID=A0A822XFB5_NELNU|nr:TPA_asm: hypothetical protein HUJ06_020350 [Nelumbo nucifera]
MDPSFFLSQKECYLTYHGILDEEELAAPALYLAHASGLGGSDGSLMALGKRTRRRGKRGSSTRSRGGEREMGYISDALEGCDRALEIEPTHSKTLLCKLGKNFHILNQYSMASDCFKRVAFIKLQIGGTVKPFMDIWISARSLSFSQGKGSRSLRVGNWALGMSTQ